MPEMKSKQFRFPDNVLRALEEHANRQCSTVADALRRLVVDGLRAAGVTIAPSAEPQAETADTPVEEVTPAPAAPYDPAHPVVTVKTPPRSKGQK